MTIDYERRNEKVLQEFITFCRGEGRQLRFWQAVYAFGNVRQLTALKEDGTIDDPFFWEGKNR